MNEKYLGRLATSDSALLSLTYPLYLLFNTQWRFVNCSKVGLLLFK